jgi:tRNA (uracil-5-)-methyltransferase
MFSHIHPDNYQAQLNEKKQQMAELFADFNLPEAKVYTSEPVNYRLRAEFRVWHDGDDFYFIMFDQQTKQKFRIDEFPVASQLINQAMLRVRKLILGNELLKRKLYQVDFLSTLSGELLISLIYHKPLDQAWLDEAEQLKQQLARLGKVDIIGRSRKQKLLLGKDYVTETLEVNGQKFDYQQIENSFTQPNGKVNQKMLSWAQEVTKHCQGDLVELYCGNGNFSIALAQNFSRVLATEISKTSVKSAQVNIATNQITNLDIIRMSAEEFSQAMNGERAFRRLDGFDLSSYNYDTVLVDPPRSGLDHDGEELASRFEQIVYISCNPETLKTNLKALTKTHKVQHFALFDQFPYTHHIECGVFMTRI